MTEEAIFPRLVARLAATNTSIGAAESLTGGLFGYLLTREPGAGDVFRGSLVTYQTPVKRKLLGITAQSVVSTDAAEQMARSALGTLGSDLAVGLTGVAGPDPQEGMPVGTVFVAAANKAGVNARRYDFKGEPDEVRHQAARAAAGLALSLLG